MSKKANAELIRALLWALDREGIAPETRPALDLAARAPGDWLDRFTPDSHGPGFPEAGEALKAAGRLRRAAAALERVALAQCNGVPQSWNAARREYEMGLTEADSARLEAERESARGKALAALEALLGAGHPGVSIEFQSDPRGAMVKLWRAESAGNGSPFFTI